MSPDVLMATHVSLAVAGYEVGVGRTVPTVAAVGSLVSVIVAGLALARAARRVGAGGRRGAEVALVLGPVGMAVGGLHGANAAGGLGTGNGLFGAYVAVGLGLLGTVLGVLALVRSRRVAGSATAR